MVGGLGQMVVQKIGRQGQGACARQRQSQDYRASSRHLCEGTFLISERRKRYEVYH